MAKKIGLFLGPLAMIGMLLLPAPAPLDAAAWKVIAMGVLMLIWWVTEAVPIPVTALLPLVALPFLGVMEMDAAAAPYANPVVFLFMGGFMLALAMERWDLHRRIALTIVRFTGVDANGIIFGFMLATALLSMWISNTATTVMMLPIALSVIELLLDERRHPDRQKTAQFSIAMMLGIAYAANIGGVATIIGTPPNSVFAGYIAETYGYEISFARWMILGIPFSAILLGLTYLLLVHILHPNRLGKFSGAQNLIEEELSKLGPVSRPEKLVMTIFFAAATCWVLRVPLNSLFASLGWPVELSDAGIAVLASIALFVVPLDRRFEERLLSWKDTERLPWGILLLFGGGLSLAGALSETGLIDLIGSQFQDSQTSFWVLLLGLTAVSLFLTEVMSNVALVTVFLPVVGGVALGVGIDPLLLTIPITMAASCAFMMPMSTPPNAIVFASGHLTVAQMVRAGIVLNLLSIGVIAILCRWLVPLLFQLPAD